MVIALIVVNVVAYVYERSHFTGAFEFKYFLVPALVHDHWYMLITSAFLHDPNNPWHLLLNMVSLAIVGPPVEAEVGRVRFAAMYLLSAVGGSVGFYLLAPPNTPGVGASGAIFGLLGAYFVLAKLRGWQTQSIVGLLLVNVLYSFTGGIAWQAHLGGLVTGGLVTLGMMWRPNGLRRPSDMAEFVQALAVVIAGSLVLGLLVQIPAGHVNI
ncbi:MAG TPA: rhomboid family intramembrane serine protease [Acidimicrobiales bacterium]|nr:rhomboid family intramembrane serine protease [Acidimicrobiales bacterium]